MPVLKFKKGRDFTMVPNEMIRSKAISFKAKGFLTLALSMAPEWRPTLASLHDKFAKEGINASRSALHELIEAGYVVRYRSRSEDGRRMGDWVYIVGHEPFTREELLADFGQEAADAFSRTPKQLWGKAAPNGSAGTSAGGRQRPEGGMEAASGDGLEDPSSCAHSSYASKPYVTEREYIEEKGEVEDNGDRKKIPQRPLLPSVAGGSPEPSSKAEDLPSNPEAFKPMTPEEAVLVRPEDIARAVARVRGVAEESGPVWKKMILLMEEAPVARLVNTCILDPVEYAAEIGNLWKRWRNGSAVALSPKKLCMCALVYAEYPELRFADNLAELEAELGEPSSARMDVVRRYYDGLIEKYAPDYWE